MKGKSRKRRKLASIDDDVKGKLEIPYKKVGVKSLNSLPDEIINKIIEYIPQNYRHYLSQTSQRLYRLSFDELNWKILKLNTIAYAIASNSNESIVLNRMLKNKHIQHIQLIGFSDHMLLDLCQNKIHSLVKTFEFDMTNILQKAKERLTSQGIKKWLDMKHIHSTLERLIIRKFDEMKDWVLCSLAMAKNLSILDMSGSSGYTDYGILSLTKSRLPLTFLSLSASFTSIKVIMKLIQSIESTLKTIYITNINIQPPHYYINESQPEFLLCLKNCDKLKHISLSPGRQCSTSNIVELFQFGNFSLERLHLQDFVNLDFDGCMAICNSKSAKTLRYMGLEFCNKVGNAGVSALLSKCSVLKELSLVGTNVKVKAFKSIVQLQVSKTLKVLNLQQNRTIGEKDIVFLSEALPQTNIIFGINDVLRNKHSIACGNNNTASNTTCCRDHDWKPQQDRFLNDIFYNPCNTPVWQQHTGDDALNNHTSPSFDEWGVSSINKKSGFPVDPPSQADIERFDSRRATTIRQRRAKYKKWKKNHKP